MPLQLKVATLRVEGSTQETCGACRGGNESMGTEAALGEESQVTGRLSVRLWKRHGRIMGSPNREPVDVT